MSLNLFEYILIGIMLAAAAMHVITLADERVDALLAAGEGFVLSDEHVLMAAAELVTDPRFTLSQRARALVDRIGWASSTSPANAPVLEPVTDFDNHPEPAEAAA